MLSVRDMVKSLFIICQPNVTNLVNFTIELSSISPQKGYFTRYKPLYDKFTKNLV